MAIADHNGLPIGISLSSARPHETTLVEATIKNTFTARYPQQIIGDRAYDSDPLDKTLAGRYGIRLISRNRINRISNHEDKRYLRRYRNRWRVERLFA